MLNSPTPDQLPTINSSDFLPRLSPWAIIGTGGLISIFGVAVVLSTVMKYNVTVRVPAAIRPAGDLRRVQAPISARVTRVAVTENQQVRAGDVIAYLDDSRLKTQLSQLQSDISQQTLQASQLQGQLASLDSQIVAQTNLNQRTLQSAIAEQSNQQRQLRDQRIAGQSEYDAAVAAQKLARDELSRYQQLARAGAVPVFMLQEKATALEVATARVNRAAAALNPTSANVVKSQEQIAQVQSQGAAALASLRQQRQQLLQSQVELQRQLSRSQKELQQAQSDAKNSIIRASVSGTILKLDINQVVQAGESVVYIVPGDAPLQIKAVVPAADINKVKTGQQVQMQVKACSFTDYGTLKGKVKTVAPDAIPASGNTPGPQGYEVMIQPDTTAVGQGNRQCALQPGMEGQADIISRQETVWEFVLRKFRLISNV